MAKPSLVNIGRIETFHGVHGELRVTPWTDFPRRFKKLEKVWVRSSDSQVREFQVERVRLSGRRVILKLAEVDTREAALELRGALLQIPRPACMVLPNNSFYVFDLIGLRVKSSRGEVIGEITDVWFMPANDVYVVRQGEKEWLIPAVREVIKSVDVEAGEMIIEPMEGLLD